MEPWDLAVQSEIQSHHNAQISALPVPKESYQLRQPAAQCAMCVHTSVYDVHARVWVLFKGTHTRGM